MKFGAEKKAVAKGCSLDAAHLQELIDLEESYWWHVAKRRLVVELLRRHVPPPGRLLEGGIGSARNLQEFQSMGYEVVGIDTMPAAVDCGRKRGVEQVLLHDLADDWPLEPRSLRAVVLLDVLEHVADPVTVLRNAKCCLRDDGAVVFTVPAYPLLMGEWDRQLGHYRRYNRRTIRQQAEAAGLRIGRLSHWNAFTLPPAIVVRALDRVLGRDRRAEFPRVRPWLNSALLGCADVERAWLRRFRVPAGLSLVGVLQK